MGMYDKLLPQQDLSWRWIFFANVSSHPRNAEHGCMPTL